MNEHKNIGSNFDDFLKEENLLEEIEIAAAKRAFDIQRKAEMQKIQMESSTLAELLVVEEL